MNSVYKSLAVALIAFSAVLPVYNVKASGFPTFDAATFTQLLKQIGLSEQQIVQFQTMNQTTSQVLANSVWIHDALTGRFDPQDLFRSYIRQQFDSWINQNIPLQYRDLVYAGAQGRIYDYLRSRQTTFPVLTPGQINPWDPESLGTKHVVVSQRVFDQSRAAAELAYDEAGKAMKDLMKLHGEIDKQGSVGSSLQLANQIAVTTAMLHQSAERVRALDQMRAAEEASAGIEGLRRWKEFVGSSKLKNGS